MNPLLTRSERNVVAHIFAGFLFNPLGRSYPSGVSAVLQRAGLLNKGDTLRSDEVTIAYEAQVRDLLFLNTSKPAARAPSATAFDIAVKYRDAMGNDAMACFEVKFLTRWKPPQLCQELKDCEYIKVQNGFSSCSLILLYPSWREPGTYPEKSIPGKVIQQNWQDIRSSCQQLADIEPDGRRLIEWMDSLRVPFNISNGGVKGPMKGLFDPPKSR